MPAVSVECDGEVQVLGHGVSVFIEGHRVDLALGGKRLGEPSVPGGQIQRLGLGLTVAGGQVDAAVAARGDLGLQLDQQRPARSPAVDDRLSVQMRLSSAVSASNRRNAPPVTGRSSSSPISMAAAGGRELVGRIAAQPLRHAVHRSAVPGGVLDRQLGQQRFGQRVILVDRYEAEVVHGLCGHHLTV